MDEEGRGGQDGLQEENGGIREENGRIHSRYEERFNKAT